VKLLIFTAEPKNFVPVKIAEAAEKAGFESAEIIDVTRLILLDWENAEIFRVVHAEQREGEEPVEPQIETLQIDESTVIIPRLNEHHLDVKLSILKRAQLKGAKMVNSPESMELCNDKLMSQVLLSSNGVMTPITYTIPGCEKSLEPAVMHIEKSGMKFPMILKTLRGTHGIGVMRVDSKASLTSVAQTLCKEGLDVLIQQYIEHEHSFRMIMVGQELLAANKRGQPKDKGEFRTNAHLGSQTEAYEPTQAEIDLGKKIVALFGCNFCAIDYIMLDDKIIVLEVNGSPGLENIQSNYPDRDLPAKVAEYALTFVNGIADLKTDANSAPPTEDEMAVDNQALAEPPALATDLAPVEPATEPTAPTTEPTNDRSPGQISEVEQVIIHQIIEEPVEARVDTGAKTSSLHVDKLEFDDDWAKFTRKDSTFKVPVARIIKVKNVHGGDNSRRPVVKLDVTINDKRYNRVEFSLNNREQMKYQVIVGRNLIELVGLPVTVKTNSEQAQDAPEAKVEIEEE